MLVLPSNISKISNLNYQGVKEILKKEEYFQFCREKLNFLQEKVIFKYPLFKTILREN